MKGLCSAVLLVLAATAVFAERQPYERYQSIVNRQMFGPLPPGFDPTKSPNEVQRVSSAEEKQLEQEQAKLQSALRFSVINVTSAGQTEVGFTDNSDPKAPKHYYLKVGETQDGWEVVSADPEKASMVVRKGEIEVSLTIGGDSSKNADATAKAGGGSVAPRRNPVSERLGGLRSRRQQREQMQRQAEAERRKAEEERQAAAAEREAKEAEEKAQREKERSEQRQQLQAIQEELKRQREARLAAEKKAEETEKKSDGSEDGDE